MTHKSFDEELLRDPYDDFRNNDSDSDNLSWISYPP